MTTYSGPGSSVLAPDYDQISRQLSFWFGESLSGQIEVGWFDAATGRLNQFRRFSTGQFEDCAAFVVDINKVPGQSTYFRPALIAATASHFTSDDDFQMAPGAWADLDREGLADNVRSVYSMCRPNMVVVTGRQPFTRAQLFWRSEEPIEDADALRDLNRRIAIFLGGDPKVTNPTSLMRIGGTIAWPWKAGRVPERTELILFTDNRPKAYVVGAIERAFPPAAPTHAHFEIQPGTGKADLHIGSSALSVESCLERIRAGDHWHDNLVRLTGHWISRGWSDAEIVTAAEALTLLGYTVAQTQREVASMIRGGRDKWAIPNPNNTIEEQEPKPFVLHPVGLLEPSKRPPRDWLVRHRLMRKHTAVTAAAPGVGKSTLTIEEAVSLASGMDFLGFGIDRPRKVAVINNEETRDELERRIEATCVRFEVPFPSIAVNLYLHSGVDAEKFVVARRGPNDSVAIDVRTQQLSEFLRDTGIELLVIDPFVQVHTVSENVNEQIEQVMMALRDISVRANCALHLVHHTRKPPAGTAHQAGDIFAVRGGGAIVGDAHFVFTLADMGQADGEALGIADADRKKFIRLDDAKGKLAPPSGARWFAREGVNMPYGLIGEEVGVLVPRSFEQALGSSDIPTFTATEILREIDKRWRDGNPFSASVQSPRYVVPVMVRDHGCSPKSARSLLRDWLANGMVASLAYDKHAKAQGLKVLAWPG